MDILTLVGLYLREAGFYVAASRIGIVIGTVDAAGLIHYLANLHRTRWGLLQLDVFHGMTDYAFDPSDPQFDPAQILEIVKKAKAEDPSCLPE